MSNAPFAFTPLDKFSGFIDQQALIELKHSIHMHLVVMAGPTQQLCAMLLKIIDFIEDSDGDRRNKEVLELSYNIVEGLALYVQRSIDERADKAKDFPAHVRLISDNILVTVGKTRGLDNHVVAKNAVLSAVANALRGLGTFTKAKYPDIINSAGVVL